ncbi:hypothetical protein SprV_0301050900 [Sparganum proliferum]
MLTTCVYPTGAPAHLPAKNGVSDNFQGTSGREGQVLCDWVLTPGPGGGGGESAADATQVHYHDKLIHSQVTVPGGGGGGGGVGGGGGGDSRASHRPCAYRVVEHTVDIVGLSVIRQELLDISGSARDLRVGVHHLALEKECQRQESTLQRLRQIQSQLSTSRYSDSQLEASAQELTDILKLNADVLRYLDSISDLEKPISSLTNTFCKSAAAISHPGAAPVTVFANKNLGDSISNCWEYISQLTDLAQFHLRAAANYQQFHHSTNELKAQIEKNVNLAEQKMRFFNPHGTVDEATRLANELQEQFNQFNRMWEDTRQMSITSRSLLPLNLRMAEVRDGKTTNSDRPQAVMVKALINIRDSSFQVRKGDELLLINNSDPIYWTVQTDQGPQQLPSVALSVIGPYSDGVFDLNKLQNECALGWKRSLERTRGRLLQYYTELFDTFCQSEQKGMNGDAGSSAVELEDSGKLKKKTGSPELVYFDSDVLKGLVGSSLSKRAGKTPRDATVIRDIDITHMHAPLKKIDDQAKYVERVQSQLSMNADEVNRYLRDVEQERQRITTELADMERMQKNQEMQIRSLSQRMHQWRSTKHLMDRTVSEYISAATQDSVGGGSQTSELSRDLLQGFPAMPLQRLHEIEGLGAVRPDESGDLPPQPPPPLRKPKLSEVELEQPVQKSRPAAQYSFGARVREGSSRDLAVIRCQTQGSRSFVFQQSVEPRQTMVSLGAKDTRDINTFVGVINQPAKVQVDLEDLSQYEVVSGATRTTGSMLKRSVSTSDLQTQILSVKNNSSTQYEPAYEGEGSLRLNEGGFSTARRFKSGGQEYTSQRRKTSDVQAQICKNVRDRGSQVGVVVIPTEIDISRVELDNLGLEVQPSKEAAVLGLRVGTLLCPASIGQTVKLRDGPGIEVLGVKDVNSMRVRHKNMVATAINSTKQRPGRDVETQIMTVHKSSRSQCDSAEDFTAGKERPPEGDSKLGEVQTQIAILKNTASVQAVAAMQVMDVPSFGTKKKIASGAVEAATKLTILPESITVTAEEQAVRPGEWDYEEEEEKGEANDVITQIGCILHSRGLHTDLRNYLSDYSVRSGTSRTDQLDLSTQIGVLRREQEPVEMDAQANRSATTADLQTQILPVVSDEGVQASRSGTLEHAAISQGKTSAKTTGSISAFAPQEAETMIGRNFSECSTQVSTKLIPTEVSLSKIGLSTTEVSFKNNQQIEALGLPADSIIYPGKMKYDTQLYEDGSSIEVADVSEVSRFLVTREDQTVIAHLTSESRSNVSGDAQTQIFTLDKERSVQAAMVLSSASTHGYGLVSSQSFSEQTSNSSARLMLTTDRNAQANGPPFTDLQTQVGTLAERKATTRDSKEQTFPSYASLLCTQCRRTLEDLEAQVDAPKRLNSAICEEEIAPRRDVAGAVSVGPSREIESWSTEPERKSTVDNMNQICRVTRHASVQVGVEMTPSKICMSRFDTEHAQIMATDVSEPGSEQEECLGSLDAIIYPARMQITTRLVDGASGFQLRPFPQTEMVNLSVDNAGRGPNITSSTFATPSSARKSSEAAFSSLDVAPNEELDAYLVLDSQSKSQTSVSKSSLRRLLTKNVNSTNLRLVPVVGSQVSESKIRDSVSFADTVCQIFKHVADAEVQVGVRLVPQELSLSKVGMKNVELNLTNRESSADLQVQIDSLLYPLDVKMSTELREGTGITIAQLDEVDQVSISGTSSALEDDIAVTGRDGPTTTESGPSGSSTVQQPHMYDLQTQILHADMRPTLGSLMAIEPSKVRSETGKSSVPSVAEFSCLLKDHKSKKRLCIVGTPTQHTSETPRASTAYIGRVLTKEVEALAKEPHTVVETINRSWRPAGGRDESCQVGVRMIPTSVDLSRLDVENLSVELSRSEKKESLKLAVGSFLCPANIQMKSELYDGSGVCVQSLTDTTEIALRTTTTTEGRVKEVQEAAQEQQQPPTTGSTKKKGLLTGWWQNISHPKAEDAVSNQSGTSISAKSTLDVSFTPQSGTFKQGMRPTSNDAVLRAVAVIETIGEREEEKEEELRSVREVIQDGTVETEFKIGTLQSGKEKYPMSGKFDGTRQLGVLRTVRNSPPELREQAVQVGVLMVPEEIAISSINLENMNLEIKSREQAESLSLRAGSLLYPAELKMRTELNEETGGIRLTGMTEIGSIQISDGEKLLNGTIEKRFDGRQAGVRQAVGGHRYDLQTQVGPITADVKLPAALVAESTTVPPMPGLPLFGSTETVARMLKTSERSAIVTTLTVNTQKPHSQLGEVRADLAQAGPKFAHQTTDSRQAEVKHMNVVMPGTGNTMLAEEQAGGVDTVLTSSGAQVEPTPTEQAGVQVEGNVGVMPIKRHYEENVSQANVDTKLEGSLQQNVDTPSRAELNCVVGPERELATTRTARPPPLSPRPRISMQQVQSSGPELLVSSQVTHPRVATRDASHQVGAILVPTRLSLEQMRLNASQLEAQTRRAISNLDLPLSTEFCTSDMYLSTVLMESAGISLVNTKVGSDIGVQWNKDVCVGESVHPKTVPAQICRSLEPGAVTTVAGVNQSIEQIKNGVFSASWHEAMTQGVKQEPTGKSSTSFSNRQQRSVFDAAVQVGTLLVPTKVQMERIGVDNLELSVPTSQGDIHREGNSENTSKDIAVSAVLCCSDIEMTPVLTASAGIQVANIREMEELDIQVKDEVYTANINRSSLQNQLYVGKYTGERPLTIQGQAVAGEMKWSNKTVNSDEAKYAHVGRAKDKTIITHDFESPYGKTIRQGDEEARNIYKAIKEGKGEVRLSNKSARSGTTSLQTTNEDNAELQASTEHTKHPSLPTVDFSSQAGSILIPAVVDTKRIDLQGAELTVKNDTAVTSHEVNIPVASLLCASTSELQSVITPDSGLQMMSPADAQLHNLQQDKKDTLVTAIGHPVSTSTGKDTATSRRTAQISIQAPRNLKENMVITMPATALLNGRDATSTGTMASLSGKDAVTTERIVALLRNPASSKHLRITTGSVSHSDKFREGRLVSQRSVKDLVEEINRGSQSAIGTFVSTSGIRAATGNQQAPRSIQAVEQFPGTSITLRSAVSCPDTSTTLRTYIGRSGVLMCEESMQVGTVLLPTKIHMNPTDSQILEHSPPEEQMRVTEAANLSSGSLLVPSTVEMTSALAEVSGIHLIGVNDVSHMAVQMEGDMLFGEAEKNPSKELDGGQFQTLIRMLQGVHSTGGNAGTMQPMTFQVTVDNNETCNTVQVSSSTKTAIASVSSQPRLATYTCVCGRTYTTSDFVQEPKQVSTEDGQLSVTKLVAASSQSAAPFWTGSVNPPTSQFNVTCDASIMPQTFSKGVNVRTESDSVDRNIQICDTKPAEYSLVQPTTADRSYAPVPPTTEVPYQSLPTVDFSSQAGSILIPAVVDTKRIDLQGAELTVKNDTAVTSHEVNIPVASLLCASTSELQSVITPDSGLQMMSPADAQLHNLQQDKKDTLVTAIGHPVSTSTGKDTATSRRTAQISIQAPRNLKENMVITMPATALLNGRDATSTGTMASLSGKDAVTTERIVALLRNPASSKHLRITTGSVSHSDKFREGRLVSQRSVKDLVEEINRGSQSAIGTFVSTSGIRAATGNQQAPRSIQAVEQFPGTSITLRSAVSCPDTSTTLRTYIGRSGVLMCEESMQVGTVLLPTKIHMNPTDSQILEHSPPEEQMRVTEAANLSSGSLLVPSTVEMTSALAEVSGIHLIGVNDVSHMAVQMEGDMLFGEAEKNPSKELDGGQFQTLIRMLQGVHSTGGNAGTMQPMTFQVTVDNNETCNTVQVSSSTKTAIASVSSQPRLATYTCVCGRTYTTSDFVQEPKQVSTEDGQLNVTKLVAASSQSAAPFWTGSVNPPTSQFNVTCDASIMPQTFSKGVNVRTESDSVDRNIQIYDTKPAEYSLVQPTTADRSYAPVPPTTEVPYQSLPTVDFSSQAGSILIPAVVDTKRIDLQGAELTVKNDTAVTSHEVNIPVASLLCASTSELQSVITTDSGLQMMSPADAQLHNLQQDKKDTLVTAIGHPVSTNTGKDTATSRRTAQISIQAPRSLKENMVITMPATALLNGRDATSTGTMASLSGKDAVTTERIVALLRNPASSKHLRITTGSVSHSDKFREGRLVSQRSVKDLVEEINRGSQSAIGTFVSTSGIRAATGNQQAPRSIQAVEQFPGTSITLRSAVSCPDTSTTLRTYIGRSGVLMCEESMQVGTVLLPTKIHMNPTDSQILEHSPPEEQMRVTEAANLSSGSLLVPSTVEMTSALAEVSGIHLIGVNDVSHMAVQMEGDMLFGEAEKNPSKELDGGQFQTLIRMLQGVHSTGGNAGTMQPMTFQVTVDNNETCNTVQVSSSTKTAIASVSSQPRLATYTCVCGRTYTTSDFVQEPKQVSTEDGQLNVTKLVAASSQSAAPFWTGSVNPPTSQFNVACDSLIAPAPSFSKLSVKDDLRVFDNSVQCSYESNPDVEETVILMACGMEGTCVPPDRNSPINVGIEPRRSTTSSNCAVQSDASVQCSVLSRQDLLSVRPRPSAVVTLLSPVEPVSGACKLTPPCPSHHQTTAPDRKRVGKYAGYAAADDQTVPMCAVCRLRDASVGVQSAATAQDTKEITTQSTRQMDLLSERAALMDQQDTTADIDHLASLKAQAAYVNEGRVGSYINELTSAEAQQLSTVVVAARELMQQTFSTTGRLTGVNTYERLKEHDMVKLLVTEYDAARRSKMRWVQTQTEWDLSTLTVAGGGTQRLETSRVGPTPSLTIVRSENPRQRDVYSSSISSVSEDEGVSQPVVRSWPTQPRSADRCDVACSAQIAPDSLEKRIQVTEHAIQEASQT